MAELMPEGAVLGGWAALFLAGAVDLDGRTGAGGNKVLPVPVCIGPVGRMRPRAGIDIDRSVLLAEDVTVLAGIPTTTVVRSCVDIMRRQGINDGVVAGDAACRSGLARPDQLREFVASHPGMKHIRRARIAADLVDERAASCPESRLRIVWVLEAGLPRPLVNRDLVDPDSGYLVGRPDLLDPESATVGEYDGAVHRELAQHTADNAREEDFEHRNLVVVRATSIDLWVHRPALVRRLKTGHADGLARDRRRDRWAVRIP